MECSSQMVDMKISHTRSLDQKLSICLALNELVESVKKLPTDSIEGTTVEGRVLIRAMSSETTTRGQMQATNSKNSISAASRIPPELLQMIYHYLDPSDFNAARHTCRTWMLASQSGHLLKTMLQRGGWWTGVIDETGYDCKSISHLKPWYLSRRLARECSLLAKWTGNGLDCAKVALPPESSRTSLRRTQFTDLTELSSFNSGPSHENECGLIIIPSTCGDFVLICDGCSIYVYSLKGPHIEPVTAIVCPRRALSVSMDTNFCHHYVAALLDGRMGSLVEFETDLENAINDRPDKGKTSRRGDTQSPCVTALKHPFVGRIGVQSFRISTPFQEQYLDSMHESSRQFTREGWQLNSGASLDFAVSSMKFPPAMAVCQAPLAVYHSICSPEDPPRTVAVCPIRQCLAFGCYAGVELHWKDCLSGKHLMKWFSLTTPTDFLYFFPRQARTDDVSRLRLISSQAGPGQRRKDPSFRFQHVFGLDEMPCVRRVEHYGAIPLNDGHHILFTDPSSGHLTLGSDRYRNLDGLAHRITLIPPLNIHVSRLCPASLYACSKDLCWGARVVALYGDELVFFSIPPDTLTYWRCQIGMPKFSLQNVPLSDDDFSTWCEWKQSLYRSRHFSKDAVQIKGSWLGRIQGVVSLAVQSATDPVVWAFCKDGTAHTWQIGRGCHNLQIMEKMVDRSGAVIDLIDRDGDRIMLDAPTSCLTSADANWNVDEDGDVQMTDAPMTSSDC